MVNVLLTRPLTQVVALEALVADSGHQPLLFPTLEIKALEASIERKQYDAVIFISANAVVHGMKILAQISYSSVFAVGAATAKKLNDYNISVDDFPQEKASSEALLSLESVSCLQSKKILIFRGRGGRETLKIGLEKTHNQVTYAQVYDRVICTLSELHKQSLKGFLSDSQGFISITSNENLDGLMILAKQLKHLDNLKNYPLIVLSERIKQYAHSCGFSQVIVTQDISDQAVVSVLA
ncbi:uroporphyrinogen-III synthase [Candidatus Thioglobus autotrophicus]|uniref:uroporphyrinogen-III synthase n=1 Tax=Candidatus Thioglobus autotrophicus TaxID=1705394 RepID=UPI00299EC63A|nr:uroporphyrinogen-III synthase [Candidatus Thioglobus autotrophicus]WPE17633.1 uroporphyrinogen-III synthase [Candidatus Thioglobus autotrophicus]